MAAVQHVGVGAVLAPKAVFSRPVFAAAGDDAVDIRDNAVIVVGMDAGRPRFDGRLHFIPPIAEQGLEALVPPELVGLQIPVPDGIVRSFGQQAETLLALAEPLLNQPPLGDVARDAQDGGHGAVAVAKRRGVGFHPPLGAFQADETELKPAGVSAARSPVQIEERRAVLGMNQVNDRPADHAPEVGRFDHPQAGRIHVQQPPVHRHDLYAFRLAFDDGAQSGLADAQGFLCLLPLRDAVEAHNHAGDRARLVPYRRADI